MAFAGIGLVAFPFDLVREFLGRPKSTITRSEYIKRAQGLGHRAKEVKVKFCFGFHIVGAMIGHDAIQPAKCRKKSAVFCETDWSSVQDVGDKLKREEREFGRGRKFRSKIRTLEQQVLLLEEDQEKLEKVFPQVSIPAACPFAGTCRLSGIVHAGSKCLHSSHASMTCDAALQGEDPDYMWIITVIMFWVKLVVGILGGCVTILWLAQVVAYIFTYPPLDPFLNTIFTALDNVFPLFGTLAFAIFCFYLIRKLLFSLQMSHDAIDWTHEHEASSN